MEPSFHSKSNEEGEEIYESLVLGRGEQQSGGGGMMREKEHMFDKVVTPSDVGKLNRLVIPKQYAEKYFPLDSSTNDKGLLLNFEDRNGKPWRFRYSYWNSSQSYVMTKGWSRFVKDKKLDAGDIVSFLRGVGDLGKDVLYIDWRRRPETLLPPPSSVVRGHHQYLSFHHPLNHPYYLQQRCRDHSLQLQQMQMQQMNPHHQSHLSSRYGILPFQSPHQLIHTGMGIGLIQMRTSGGGDEIDEEEEEPMVFESVPVPVVQGKAVAKRLRLFGVNMDCPISESETILPSTAAPPPPSASTSSSSSSSSMMPYSYIGTPLLQKMSADNKGKGSLSLDFDV